jgi:DNA-binding MarR family transcriptional regulator
MQLLKSIIVDMSTKEVDLLKNTIGRLISILHRQSQIYITNALKEFNITSSEYAFLLSLYRKDGVTQDELSSYLYIDKSATARAIKSLEEKGYVIRNKDNVDKRCNRVFITEKANTYRAEIFHRVHSWSDFLEEGMDKETIDIVYGFLENMVEKVEKTKIKKEMEE